MSDYSFSVFPNDNFLDFRLFQYGWEQCVPLYSFGPFVRNHYLFHYVISGQGTLMSTNAKGDSHTYRLGPGQGFLICPGQVNTYSADEEDPWKYVWLEFDGLRASSCLNAAGLDLSHPIYRPGSRQSGDGVCEQMLYITDHPNTSPLHLVAHLCLFLDELVRTSSSRRALQNRPLRDFYIQEAVTFIQQNIHRGITVEEVAGVCKLNRNYFSKMFKEVMGCTTQEFMIQLRLSTAAEQMLTTNDLIGDIARRCGYPNQLHFSRAFKKRYGLSPREWRTQNKTRGGGREG